jgi:hypothetical protein
VSGGYAQLHNTLWWDFTRGADSRPAHAGGGARRSQRPDHLHLATRSAVSAPIRDERHRTGNGLGQRRRGSSPARAAC